jgi:hypothetical protein
MLRTAVVVVVVVGGIVVVDVVVVGVGVGVILMGVVVGGEVVVVVGGVVVVVVVGGTTPMPVRVTVCTPLPSLPSISQVAETGPGVVGANFTDSATEVSAEITVPSFSVLSAENPLLLGGTDSVIVRSSPPWSPTEKGSVADAPILTLPKFSVAGMVVIWANGAAVPDIATPKFPTLVFKVTTELKTCTKFPEDPGGAKFTPKTSVPPAASVCAPGGLLNENGAVGDL